MSGQLAFAGLSASDYSATPKASMEKRIKQKPDLFSIFTHVLLVGALLSQIIVITWLART